MSERQQDRWPPIISNADRSAWIVWRDIAITAFIWGLFFFLVARELDLAWQARPLPAGQSVDPADTRIEEFLLQMKPTVRIIVLLVIVLGLATLASSRRRNTALRQPQPISVPDSELARDLGLGEQELNELRQQKVVALNVDERGKVLLRSHWKSSAGDPSG